jgi:hypothetical protein
MHEFQWGSYWSELPGGQLFVTGGNSDEVVSIDTLREFGVVYQQPMLIARMHHCAVYYAQHLYVLGGEGLLQECERYVCAERSWEAIPPLPTGAAGLSGVVQEDCLYALGGLTHSSHLDLIQKLRLDQLTWEVMQLKLPHAAAYISSFVAKDSQVYLVINASLYSFQPKTQQIDQVKLLSQNVISVCGPSYYSSGVLYYSNCLGSPLDLVLHW